MRNMLLLPLMALLLALSACVTINIYFPAAEAEKAADKIIDDVWQIKPGEQAPPAPTPPADAPAPTK